MKRLSWIAGLLLSALVAMRPGSASWDEGPSSGVPAWRYIGPDGASADDIAIDPANPRRLYLASNRGVVFRSDDGALNWEAVSAFQPGGEWDRGVVLGPVNDDTVFLISSALYISRDAGRTWTKVLGRGVVTRSHVASVASSRATPSTLYAGTYDCVFKSTDAGGTWFKASAGIDDASVSSLALDPANARVIYAGTSEGIFKSTDGAMTWAKADRGVREHDYALDLYAAPGRSAPVFAGTDWCVYRSTDFGGSWFRVKRLGSSREQCRISGDPMKSAIEYLATDLGAFETTDGPSVDTGEVPTMD
ncbi:MAG: hypothetical protein AB1714_29685 [Acidobacteriota bacterium]